MENNMVISKFIGGDNTMVATYKKRIRATLYKIYQY